MSLPVLSLSLWAGLGGKRGPSGGFLAFFRDFGHKILYLPDAPSSTEKKNLFLRAENAIVSGSATVATGVWTELLVVKDQ